MHDVHTFLANLAMVLCVAAVTTVLFQRLRLPVVFGYMLAGLLVGPHFPVPLVADRAIVQALAELGVVLLMFSLGLEFSLGRIARLGPTASVIAMLETSLMIWLGVGVGRWLGWSTLECLFAGGMIAISSTTIILKAFREQGVRGPAAELVFSILIAEDVLAVGLLAVLTPLASGHALSASGLAVTVLRFVGFLAGALTLGLLVVPRVMRYVVKLGRAETTLVASVGLCFAGALAAQKLGYSVALGAFLAGSLVAESGEAPTVEKLVEPIRDLFAAVFFVAVGMMIEPAVVVQHAWAILAFTLLVLAGKVGAVSASAFLTGRGLQHSVKAGMSLSQIGEFSLIIVAAGVATGAVGDFLYSIAIAVSAITTLLTPWLIRGAPAASAALDRRLPRPLQTFVALYGTWIENAGKRPARAAEVSRMRRVVRRLLLDAAMLSGIVLGAVLEGSALTRWVAGALDLGGVAAQALVTLATVALASPFAVGMVRTSADLGRALAARAFPDPEPGRLDLAAAPRRAMIVTVQLAAVLVIGIVLGNLSQPVLPAPVGVSLLAGVMTFMAVMVWRNATNLRGHARAGAEVIVAALARQGRAPAPRGTHDASGEAEGDALARAWQLLPGLGSPVPVALEAASPAVGSRLGELELRGRTGATVLAIVRGEQVVLVPDGHEMLAAGDVLALAGTAEAVAQARALLLDHEPGERRPR